MMHSINIGSTVTQKMPQKNVNKSKQLLSHQEQNQQDIVDVMKELYQTYGIYKQNLQELLSADMDEKSFKLYKQSSNNNLLEKNSKKQSNQLLDNISQLSSIKKISSNIISERKKFKVTESFMHDSKNISEMYRQGNILDSIKSKKNQNAKKEVRFLNQTQNVKNVKYSINNKTPYVIQQQYDEHESPNRIKRTISETQNLLEQKQFLKKIQCLDGYNNGNLEHEDQFMLQHGQQEDFDENRNQVRRNPNSQIKSNHKNKFQQLQLNLGGVNSPINAIPLLNLNRIQDNNQSSSKKQFFQKSKNSIYKYNEGLQEIQPVTLIESQNIKSGQLKKFNQKIIKHQTFDEIDDNNNLNINQLNNDYNLKTLSDRLFQNHQYEKLSPTSLRKQKSSKQINIHPTQSNKDQSMFSKKSVYDDYISKQYQKIEHQKKKTQILQLQISTIGLKSTYENTPIITVEQQININFHEKLKYMLRQVIDLTAIDEILKIKLKNKSFQILNKIFQYGNNLPSQYIKMNQFHSLVAKMMPQQAKSGIDSIVKKIFKDKHILQFDQFSKNQAFQVHLSEREIQQMWNSVTKIKNNNTQQLLKKLFNVWIQIRFYEEKIKQLFIEHPSKMQDFLTSITNGKEVDEDFFQSYVSEQLHKNKQFKIKCQLYLYNILGQKTEQKFINWIYQK